MDLQEREREKSPTLLLAAGDDKSLRDDSHRGNDKYESRPTSYVNSWQMRERGDNMAARTKGDTLRQAHFCTMTKEGVLL